MAAAFRAAEARAGRRLATRGPSPSRCRTSADTCPDKNQKRGPIENTSQKII